jgi:hypothetical protein
MTRNYSRIVNYRSQALFSQQTDSRSTPSKKSSTRGDVDAAGNSSYGGLDTDLNTIAGSLASPSTNAKRWINGWSLVVMGPLGSFFPLGFLMHPQRS